jgi:hypothetical protein
MYRESFRQTREMHHATIKHMTHQNRGCPLTEVEHLKGFVAYAKTSVDRAWYYPPLRAYRYMVALALYSKALTVAEATIALLEQDFADEAFGLTRTLVDIFITLRYIGNRHTEERARLYYQFFTKDTEQWSKVISTYWPHKTHVLDTRTKRLAAAYASPHKWAGKGVGEMALEPDTVETDPQTGQAAKHDFDYRVIYRWTSHYVHPTIVALEEHLVQAGRDNFVIHKGKTKNMCHLAAFNVASYVSKTMVCFYRCMGDPQPSRVAKWSGALVAHLARRHP